MRVLVVEADVNLAQVLELSLRAEQMNVETADLGEEAIDLAKIYDYDLITLALDLPDIGGLEVLRRLRDNKIATPILMLTGHDEIADKMRAFAAGADDYLTKPFHRDELVARIRAIVRRARGHSGRAIKIDEIEIDLDERTAWVAGARLDLTGKEYQMLELMALRRGSCITKEMFLNHLYGGRDEPELKMVDVFSCKLRQELRRAGAGDGIRTIWGRGYVLGEAQSKVAA